VASDSTGPAQIENDGELAGGAPRHSPLTPAAIFGGKERAAADADAGGTDDGAFCETHRASSIVHHLASCIVHHAFHRARRAPHGLTTACADASCIMRRCPRSLRTLLRALPFEDPLKV
jgi:hypothetical protein